MSWEPSDMPIRQAAAGIVAHYEGEAWKWKDGEFEKRVDEIACLLATAEELLEGCKKVEAWMVRLVKCAETQARNTTFEVVREASIADAKNYRAVARDMQTRIAKAEPKQATEGSAVEAALHRVLRATGRIVPQTEEEVAQAEVVFHEDSVELPARLLTPPTAPLRPRSTATEGTKCTEVTNATKIHATA